MFSYCLITDRNYINSTICLTNKIDRQNINILCLDDYTEKFFNLNFKSITTHNVKKIENKFNLANLKLKREWRSYVFTLKSFFLTYLMDDIQKDEYLVYLDSDLYLFSDVEKFEQNITKSSIHISPHNFDEKNSFRSIYGDFNAGLLIFKKDDDGLKVLDWWKRKCFEDCSLTVSENVYADQKYLNKFHLLTKSIKVLNNPGINTAPWNFKKYKCEIIKNKLYLDNNELIIYHFHSFKMLFSKFYKTGLKEYDVVFDEYTDFIYSSYSKELKIIIDRFENKNNTNANIKEILKSFFKQDVRKLY